VSFNYLKNSSLEEAKQGYLNQLKELGFSADPLRMPTAGSCGRVNRDAVYAQINAPHYPASAMDGIAVRASDTFGATETTPVILETGSFTALDTGDPVPDDKDAVIMIEDVIFQPDGSAKLFAAAMPWQNVRQVGEDICAHEMILPSRSQITPSAVGAMLAGGVMELTVLRKPVVGIIPTGDEIVKPTPSPKEGEIIEFNSSIFQGILHEKGCEVICFDIVPDRRGAISAAIREALSQCDIVLVNAGSSAGRDDYAAEVIGELGEVYYHGIAIKPGKPAILGAVGKKPVIGIPGYPVSGIIVLEKLVSPVIDLWYGRYSFRNFARANLTKTIVSGLKYEEFVRVRLGYVAGKLMAAPLNRGAGVVTSFMRADGILTVPQNTEGIEAGTEVTVELIKPMEQIKNTVVVTGSHDPLIDELSDLIRLEDPSCSISSSHVGSMGAIMAAKRSENHMGGIHLLNEEDGSYNAAFIRKFFPNGGVRLVECVQRVQGLMVAPGNPLGLKGIQDLSREGLRYVNRQKGSGTRVLIDYLCKKEGIDTASIYGYEREEFTHNAVATQIAAGSADAGMGIYSAAKIYGLDFIPICDEQYDFLIPEYALELPAVQKVLELLKSPEFKVRIEAMGGYRIEHPGTFRPV